MSLCFPQIAHLIARITQAQGLFSMNSLHLQLLTSAQETHLGSYLRQWPKGPGLGIFSMEPIAEKDVWERSLLANYQHRRLLTKVSGVLSFENNGALEWNLAYQIGMCRLYYLLVPEPLPHYKDIQGMAEYWDQFWNRNPSKGFPEQAVENYKKYCLRKVR